MKNNKVGSVIKTETKIIAIVVICLVITVIGISYALFLEVKGNEKNQIVKAGTLEFSYANGSQITNASNSDCFIPMNNEEALRHSECEYKISITNTGTLPGNYNINLNSESVENPLALNKLKVILKKEGQVISGYPKEGTTTSLIANEKIEAGSVINYSVQVYVDEDNESLTADDDEKNISIKINGDAIVNSEEVNPAMLAVDYIKNIATVENGDGLYKVPHEVSEISEEWNQMEYRYAGANPNNYVSFNNEIWRIIGLVNVKTENGIEQRVKIIRKDEINGQKDFGNYAWDYGSTPNWTKSSLKNMLNDSYYNSSIGNCYIDGTKESQCDFNSGIDLPKGLDGTARNMIDKEVVWNIGACDTAATVAKQFYEKERGASTGYGNLNPTEWSKKTKVGETYNGIGLMYPSDYGFAVGGDTRDICLTKNLSDYSNDNCNTNNWLKTNSYSWTLTTYSTDTWSAFYAFFSGYIGGYSSIGCARGIWPTLYLKSNIKITSGNGTEENPFILK